jgi:dipeptidyl aminopeptidase/acylaminoacyl peptidase
MLQFLGTLAFVLLVHPAAPQEGPSARPLAVEDYYRLKSVGQPRISPDGRWVAYTVSMPVEETNGNVVESWLVAADGRSAPLRLLRDGAGVAEPRWGADGRLRVRQGSDTWVVDPARPGDPPTADASLGPEGIPSPDGRWVAMARDVPGTTVGAPTLRGGAGDASAPGGAPSAASDFRRRHDERFKGADLDWYPFLQDGQPFPIPDPRARATAEVFLLPADGSGEARQLTRLGLRASTLRWSPDGRTLLFTADEAVRDELEYARTDLFAVTVDGVLTRLTDDGYVYSDPDFSPDGRWISYVRSFGLDMIIGGKLDHGGPQDLYVRPAGGGEAVNLTAAWDLDPGSVTWAPDGRSLYVTAGIGGASHLFRVPVAGGAVERITRGERRLNGIDFDAAMRRMAFTVGELDRPADVWVADVDGKNERRLTDAHAGFLAGLGVGATPSRSVTWSSYDGTPVEGFLIFPHGYDPAGGPYPLVIVNHGGPHSASGYAFDFKNQLFAAHGHFVLLPNFRSSTGYGDAFKWATWGSWGTKDGEDVLSGVDHLAREFPIDLARVGTTGHSYGGILTNWLITRYPDRFAAAVSGAGESNWTSNFALSDIARTKETEFFGRPWEPRAREIMIRQSAFLNSEGVRTPTLFVHGAVDYRVPLSGALQLYTSMKKQRVPTRLLIYEGQPHGIRGHWNVVHRMIHELEWWETWLKPTPAGTAGGREDR